VAFLPENKQLVDQELHVDFLLLNLLFGHYLYCELLATRSMLADTNLAEGSLPNNSIELISFLNFLDGLEFLEVINMKSMLLRWGPCLFSHALSDLRDGVLP